MSEGFEELLSGVVDSAGSAARKPGAAAARTRGRQRRARQRLAASALTIAVVGGAGSIAAVSLHQNGSGNVPAAHSPTSGNPSASAKAPTTNAALSASPSASRSGTGSTRASSTGAPASSSSNTNTTHPLWSTVPQSWLSPSQVPLDGTLHWSGGAAGTGVKGISVLQQTPIPYPCMNHGSTSYVTASTGYAANSFTATADVSSTGFDGTPGATQSYDMFTSNSAAHAAYQAIQQDVAECAGISAITSANTHRPMTGTAATTATASTGFAYTFILRDNQGAPAQENGNYGAASDYHAYVVLSGNLIEVVSLAGGPAVDSSSNDAAALNALISTLN